MTNDICTGCQGRGSYHLAGTNSSSKCGRCRGTGRKLGDNYRANP